MRLARLCGAKLHIACMRTRPTKPLTNLAKGSTRANQQPLRIAPEIPVTRISSTPTTVSLILS